MIITGYFQITAIGKTILLVNDVTDNNNNEYIINTDNTHVFRIMEVYKLKLRKTTKLQCEILEICQEGWAC